MHGYTESNEIILLFDQYSLDSQRLHTSLKRAGYEHLAVAIEDDGFLPEGVMSIYGYFTEDFKWKTGCNRKRSCSKIIIPEFSKLDEEYEGCQERGQVFYIWISKKRYVKSVKWYDKRDIIRCVDHYNRYDAMYARTIFGVEGQRIKKLWFSPEGEKVMVEDMITGGITLNEGDSVKKFERKTDLIVFFFVKTGLWQSRIFYNSLSTPFFVSNRLGVVSKSDILFWQEPIGDEIPGNMQMILDGRAGRTSEIVVQKKLAYERLLELGADESLIHRLGYIYSFKKKNSHKAEALICTNSENVEHCCEIVREIPQMHFHIVAVTAMSEKLLSVGEYENVSLYPGAGMDLIRNLFQNCDFYLDINQEGEIVSAVYRAFLHNHLIFAFEETIHNRDYVTERWIYPAKDWKRMVEDIRVIMEDAELLERCLQRQREEAMAENKQTYNEMLEPEIY
nr:accessory Sec system glycosylation chaperone GtfB [uncultured Schaedlerella sp.]